jgi:transposase InsO family protein
MPKSGKIKNIQIDNGSEFLKYFDKACKELNINHYFSRNHTPKDNSTNERFNRTLKEEFLRQGNFYLNLQKFNQVLTEWLVEYNFQRPHQALGYIPPINFQAKYLKVLPMYPSSTLT